MKQLLKKLGLVLTTVAIVVTSVIGLTACNGKESNKLVVATEAKFNPFEYVDANGNFTGFDMELIELLAKKMGYDGVEIKDMDFDSVIGSVTTNNADVAIAAMTINPKRAKSVDFADPYYTNSAQWILKKKGDTKFVGTTKEALDKELEGKKIGVAKGQTGYYYVLGGGDFEFEGVKNAKMSEYQDMPSAVTALKKGMVDCVLSDNAVAEEIIAKNPDIEAIKVPLTVESYGIAVKKGNTELLNKLNVALKEAKADGSYDKLYNKYFGE